MISDSEDEISAPSKSLTEIRSDVSNTTLLVMLGFAVPAVGGSLSRIFAQGWLPVMGLHIALLAALMAVVLARHRLSYFVRAGFVVALMFTIGAGGIISFGLSTEVTVFLVGSSILAACFFGTRPGIVVIGLSTVLLGIAYLVFTNGILPQPEASLYAYAPATWLTAVMGVILACMGPMVAVARFIRDLERERQRAEVASAAKSQFLAMMSHELRTPLTGVLGMAELLQTDTLSAQQSDRVKRLSQSANSLLGLVNDILDFSKIEANRMAIEEIPFRMRDIESAVCNLLRPAAAKKHLDLTWSLDASAAGVFIGDSTRIRQVLINLVSNAIKFTEVGSVSVKISREGHSDENGSLIFEVKDTGIGISAEHIGRLFEPFVQADEGTARKFGGTGLGLAITRRLVEAMGGEISVRSKLGDGSTFRVVMPARAAEEGTLAEAPDDVAAQAGRAKRTGHVLVAEDVETSRYLLESMLSRMGHTVEAVADGAAAIEAANAGEFDVIVMDMQMPIADGVEATRAIRASNSKSANLPIIALTADVLQEDHARFLFAGVNVVLTKPVDWVSLGAEIDRQLSSRVESAQVLNFEPAMVANEDESGGVALDEVLLDELGDTVGQDVLAPMLTTFRENMVQYRDQLTKAAHEEDIKKLKSTAHALKGLSAQFGAAHVSQLARKIEKQSENLDGVRRVIPELTEGVDEALRALGKYLEKPAS